MLAVLLLAAPAGAAATGPANEGQAAVTSALQATPETPEASDRQTPGASDRQTPAASDRQTPGVSDRLDALPPLRVHVIKATVARHRSGGHPLAALLGRAPMSLLPACAFLLIHRCARATQALPGRLALSYPMRT
jgi:hypothetical protein